jgi:hypothetical protein
MSNVTAKPWQPSAIAPPIENVLSEIDASKSRTRSRKTIVCQKMGANRMLLVATNQDSRANARSSTCLSLIRINQALAFGSRVDRLKA